ncbi:MAG TPA: S8 family serine peptidase [bacterium]|nr:S8 family serine peptidase [bacterium]
MLRFRTAASRARAATALVLSVLFAVGCGGGDEAADSALGPQQLRVRWVPPHLYPPSPDHYVLQLQAALTPAQIQLLQSQFGLSVVTSQSYEGDEITLLNGPVGVNLADVEGQLSGTVIETSVNDAVSLVEGTTLIGSFAVGEWSTEVASGTGLESLNAELLHESVRGAGVIVAVLDTGADLDHPHLVDNVSPLPASSGLFSSEQLDGDDDDGDGLVDEAYGHGTHVTGIVCQIAPDVTVIPVRVLNADGVGSIWDLMRGLLVAAEHGAQIFNLSLATTEPNDMLETRFQTMSEAGLVVIAAAGNGGNGSPTFPGSSAFTVGVAAVDAQDLLTSFSGSGPLVAMAAPGVNVLSTYPSVGDQVNGARATGTSMAAPSVCGSLALLMEGLSTSGPFCVSVLKSTASTVYPSGSVVFGRVNPVQSLGTAR